MSKALTVKELYDALAKLMKENPGCADFEVVVKVEADGLSMHEKVYAGNIKPGNWDDEMRDYDYTFMSKEEWVEDEDGVYKENAVCINQ